MKLVLLFSFLLPIAAQIPPDDLAESLNRANTLAHQNQLEAAENIARQSLQSHPSSAEAHFLLGYILFMQSKAKESLAEYTEGAKYRTPRAVDLKVVASDYVVLGDFADADKWFSKVVEWTPDDVQAWYDLGRTKYNENRFDEAINAFKRTLQLDPQNVKAEDNLGLSYEAEGHPGEAMAAYQHAIASLEKNGGQDFGPYLDQGALLLEAGHAAEALPPLNKALAISPSEFRVHRELGKAYLHLNQLEKARGELERAIELAPGNASLHFMLSQVYRKQGLLDEAKAETERYSALK